MEAWFDFENPYLLSIAGVGLLILFAACLPAQPAGLSKRQRDRRRAARTSRRKEK